MKIIISCSPTRKKHSVAFLKETVAFTPVGKLRVKAQHRKTGVRMKVWLHINRTIVMYPAVMMKLIAC